MTLRTPHVLGTFEMRVEIGKVREFARATGATDPAYFEDERPPVPPTFLTTAAFWQPPEMQRPYEAAGMDLSRVLHGQQRYEYLAPVRAGDVLSVEIRIDSIETKSGARGGAMRLAHVVSEFRDPEGSLVARGTSTTIETAPVA